MMEQEYRREMDRVELSPDQRARIVQAMVEEPPRKQRRRPPMRLLAAAVLVCGGPGRGNPGGVGGNRPVPDENLY